MSEHDDVRVSFEMIVGEVGTSSEWLENVPDQINGAGAPDLSGLPAVRRAQLTVDWFNSTMRPHERERELRKVIRVRKSLIYPVDDSSPASTPAAGASTKAAS
ncbi:MAG: hypothetical protein ACR2RF_15930 [Geminicoccaceae bacterium]